jgi:hypothetical protein
MSTNPCHPHSYHNDKRHATTHLCTEGRLTRAAFTRTLQTSRGKTIFDIQGLRRLKHTFATLDADAAADETSLEASATTLTPTVVTTSIPKPVTRTTTPARKLPYEACKALLDEAAGTEYDKAWLPDAPDREYSELLSQPKEFYGSDFTPPSSKEQVAMLKRDRNQFTAAEDSLVFRGVVRNTHTHTPKPQEHGFGCN